MWSVSWQLGHLFKKALSDPAWLCISPCAELNVLFSPFTSTVYITSILLVCSFAPDTVIVTAMDTQSSYSPFYIH